jgi:hydroxymethylpyrimidine kinase/phosphomethylpyrimidine kinase
MPGTLRETMSERAPVVLTVAGSDPSGGAGIQGDLKTIHTHGGYGAAIPTLVTVQNTHGVEQVKHLSADLVRSQLANLLGDLEPRAAKTGALGAREIVHILGSVMAKTQFPWVVDPVWLPSRGAPLARGDVIEAYREVVIPRAALVTPNAREAGLLVEQPVRSVDDARRAAEAIAMLGAPSVLVKGGHLEGADLGTDVLLHDGQLYELRTSDVVPGRFHGTGCALSASIATRLALGKDIPTSVAEAKNWVTGALRHAFAVGKDAVPVNHLWPVANEL